MFKLVGTDEDGWQHVAVIREDMMVEIDSVSPGGDFGGASVIKLDILIKNFSKVLWRIKSVSE